MREDQKIGVVLITGAGPAKDGKYAFCAGGAQSVRGHGGYIDDAGVPRLNILDVQKLIRSMPKVVIALVAGYAIGGGHVLHVMCDLTIAADNAIFGQVGPEMEQLRRRLPAAPRATSSASRTWAQKKAREILVSLCRQYNAAVALEMNLVNKVVPVAELESEGVTSGAGNPRAAARWRSAARNPLAAPSSMGSLAYGGSSPATPFMLYYADRGGEGRLSSA